MSWRLASRRCFRFCQLLRPYSRATMYWASASLAWNLPASQSSEEWRLSAVASHRRYSCSSSLASHLSILKFRWEGKLRDILAPHSSPPLRGGPGRVIILTPDEPDGLSKSHRLAAKERFGYEANSVSDYRTSITSGVIGQNASSSKVLRFLQSVSASRANFHEPSLCRFNTRRSLRRKLTGLSLADILNVAS
jgi:hypothetical protein